MKTLHILNEMISTECTYREGLELINRVSAPLAEQASRILDPLDQMVFTKGLELLEKITAKQATIERLFGTLQSQLTTDIDEGALMSTIAMLNNILEQAAKDYANYAIFYENFAQNLAPKLNDVEAQRQIQHLLNKAGGNHQTLASFLITPVQRFIRYHMLINELYRSIPDEHPAKAHFLDLNTLSGEYCQNINQTAEFFASVKEKYTSIILHNDSKFRRHVKECLDDIMQGIHQPPHLLDILRSSGLIINCKHKKFSNKREYHFVNQAGETIFDIIVNRHAMAFQFTEHFDALPINEKIALFRLQYFLTLSIENRTGRQMTHYHTKQNLGILGEVDYVNLGTNDVDEDEDNDHGIAVISPTVTPAFGKILNNRLKLNPGLTRQGSYVKPEYDGRIQPAEYPLAMKWQLPGLA